MLVERNLSADEQGETAFVGSAQHVGCEARLPRAFIEGNHDVLIGRMIIGDARGVMGPGFVFKTAHLF